MKIKLKNEKDWVLKPYDAEAAKAVSKALGIPHFLAKLLAVRGITAPAQAADFLSAETLAFHDPFLLEDMEKAAARILSAIGAGERIMIYGDYDVDGISSTAALYRYLLKKGANVSYYIPDRLSEGYGLNRNAIDRFRADGVRLIITVDTGITARAEAEYIAACGMSLIVTDHHECPEILPAAYAVINPKRRGSKYPFPDLAGVGVVFKLLCAMEQNRNLPALCEEYLDIVSLGTVADVMPMIGENRRIVANGLSVLCAGAHVGIRALLEEAFPESASGSKKITSFTIGFAIAPRLNAAGRIGNVAHAAELLVTSDASRAKGIASELCALNRERQALENEILAQAVEKINTEIDFENDRVILLSDDGWHQGVIGIVASRLTEKYGLPCILVTFSGEIGKGSARSIEGFNINDAFAHCSGLLLKYGGHELAAGLSIEKEKLPAFRSAINEYAREVMPEKLPTARLNVDCEILPEEIDLAHAELILQLEPYGSGNPAPVFMLTEAVLEAVTPIGMNKHLKLALGKGGKHFSAVYFNQTPETFGLSAGDTIDAAFYLEINEFRGARSVQLNIRDVRISGETQRTMNLQAKAYLRAITAFSAEKENIPDMPAFRAMFVYLRTALKKNPEIDIFRSARSISRDYSVSVTPCMLNLALDVFAEMGLINLERATLNEASISLLQVDGKVNLENSKLLTRLRASNRQ